MDNQFNVENIRELAVRLCEGILHHANDSESNKSWTAAVHQTLHDEASLRSWALYPDERPYKGEFLCDFMLFQEGYGCRIACESQWWWKTDPLPGLDWAFDKLCGVKSDLKLFIYEGKVGNFDVLSAKYLENNAQINKGEAFLAMRWTGRHFENQFWIAPQNGVQTTPVKFSHLPDVPLGRTDFAIDKLGNNSAVRCPQCHDVFIISQMLNRKTARACPHCGKSSAGFRDGTLFVEERDKG